MTTVNEVSSHLCKILTPIIVKTYLQTGETLPYHSTHGCDMLRLIHMKPSTDTNTTSVQWSYLHKNIIFLVITLILKHVLLTLMQKYFIPVINCLLCCMNWYSWSVIHSSHSIGTCSHRIRIIVKFYNHTLQLRYGYIPMQYYPPLVLFS